MYDNYYADVEKNEFWSVDYKGKKNYLSSEDDYLILRSMAIVRDICTLGRSIRKETGIKIRQPLNLLTCVISDPEIMRVLKHDYGQEFIKIITDEVNVKNIHLTQINEGDIKKYISQSIKPNFKVLGPKLGSKIKKLKETLSKCDAQDLLNQLNNNNHISLPIEGGEVSLTKDDLIIEFTPIEGHPINQGRGVIVVLDTIITKGLRLEGIVRDIIRGIQNERKKLNLERDKKIILSLHTHNEEIKEAIHTFVLKIQKEVLATKLHVKNSLNTNNKIMTDLGEVYWDIIQYKGERYDDSS